MTKKEILTIKDVTKNFVVGKQKIEIIKKASFTIYEQDFVIIFGPSGCGKSTLLHIMLGLEEPSSGQVNLLGQNLYHLDEDNRAELRKKQIGMIYQQAFWMQSRTVLQNVAFPLTLLGKPRSVAYERALESLKLTGMDNWQNYFPTELSSGQQQKVSLARALINNPTLIVADEPTGNLDSGSSLELMNLMNKLNHAGKTIIMVTHDLEFLKFGSRVVEMKDGEVIQELTNNHSEIKKASQNGKKHLLT